MDALTRAVAEQGYTEPTPIQKQAIPVVLEGRDLIAAAQTGTGKTAGFTLPLLQRLTESAPAGGDRKEVRCLVLTPTRELAAQVEESIKTYGAHLPLTSAVIFGGVGFQPQVDALKRGVDILVATPGRLLDHLAQKTIVLRSVEILVLDEADRMLDMGFIPDVRRVLSHLPDERQNLLFSATFPDEIRKLAQSFMDDPVTVEVARRNTPAELVAQVVHPVDAHRKRELLAQLVKAGDWRQVLVFTRTKHGANRLAEQLTREGIEADAIHGNKSQGARTRALARFKGNELRVLVATDIAARGLDIEALPHVVNYDLPQVPEDYVHRIGRTGRAGAEGEAISFVSAEERPLLAQIERLMNRTIEQREIPGFEPGLTAPPPGQERREQRGQGQRPQQQRGDGGGRGGQQRRRGGGQGQPRQGGHPQRQGGPRDPQADGAPRGEVDGNRIQHPRGPRPQQPGQRGNASRHARGGQGQGYGQRQGQGRGPGGRGQGQGQGRPWDGGRGNRPQRQGPPREQGYHSAEREAQMREARRLMEQEQAEAGEQRAEQQPHAEARREERRPAQTAALLGGGNRDDD